MKSIKDYQHLNEDGDAVVERLRAQGFGRVGIIPMVSDGEGFSVTTNMSWDACESIILDIATRNALGTAEVNEFATSVDPKELN